MGGYNQGHNQGEKDTSVKLENQDYVVKQRTVVDEKDASVRVKNQEPVVEKETFVDEKDASVKLENQKCVEIKEPHVDVRKHSIHIATLDVGTNFKPNEETKLNTDKKRRPRSYRKRVHKLKAKGIAHHIAKQLAEMKPKQMLRFVKHNVRDLIKVKSYLEDINTTTRTQHECIKMKKIKAKHLKKMEANSSLTLPTVKKNRKQLPVVITIKDKINSLDRRQMNIIRYCLMKDIVLTEKSERPKIKSWSFENDHIEAKCVNTESRLWLERHVSQLKPWPDAKLSTDVKIPNIIINNVEILKASKMGTATSDVESISDDNEVSKMVFNPLTIVNESKDFKLYLTKKEVSKDIITSNMVDNPNTMSMLDVKEFDIKKEDSQRPTSESLTPKVRNIHKHAITVENLVSNSKTNFTNFTITKSPHKGENKVSNDIVWETHSNSEINPINIRKTIAAINTANFTNNITVVHEKLSGSQKRKRKRAIEAMEHEAMNKKRHNIYNCNVPVFTNSYTTYMEERTNYRNKMAENNVNIFNRPIYNEETTKDNVANYPKSVEINNIYTENTQSSLMIKTNSDNNTNNPVISKRNRKNKRQILRERRRLNDRDTSLPLDVNTNSVWEVNPRRIRNVDGNEFNTDESSNRNPSLYIGSNQDNSHKNRYENSLVINKDINTEDVIVISDDDTPVRKGIINDMYKAYRAQSIKKALKTKHVK